MKYFFAYLLRCSDDSFYCGHTDDMERRLAEHQSGEFEGYTSSRRPLELVWHQEFATREQALAAESQIKGWTRAKKEALIEGKWDEIEKLSERKKKSTDRD